MDHRLYFIFGDLLSNIIVGILMAVSATLLISTGWNMFIAMVVMMLLAMIVSLFLTLLFGHRFRSHGNHGAGHVQWYVQRYVRWHVAGNGGCLPRTSRLAGGQSSD